MSDGGRFRFFDGAVDGTACDAVRDRVCAAGFSRYEIGDRGRYELGVSHAEPWLFARLATLARAQVHMAVSVETWRWTRLRHGDYATFKDDARRACDGVVEVCLDVSAAASDQGQIIYRTAGTAATVPQRPGGVAIIDRRGPMARYERYLGVRFGAGEIVRLTLVLRPRPDPAS